MADAKGHAASLDTLEASIKSILLNVGSVFGEKIDGDSDRLAQTKGRLRVALPSALSNFHGALDVLETEIIKAKAVMTRDLLLMQAATKAPATDAPIGKDHLGAATSANTEPSLLDNSSFELINSEDTVMSDAAPAAPSTDEPKPNLVKSEPPDSTEAPKSNDTVPGSTTTSQLVADAELPKPTEEEQKKPLTPAPDAQGNNALGIHVEADAKANATTDATAQPDVKHDPAKDQQATPDNGFNELLPGLSMYANDPNNEPPSLDIDTLNDHSLSNAFGDAAENTMDDFESNLFGEEDLGGGMSADGTSFHDMITFDTDTAGAQSQEGQGPALDMFDDDFFNLSGE